MAKGENLVKIAVDVDGKIESLWAESVGHNRFRLRNQPALAWGLSFGDVVLGKIVGGRLFVDRVVERGGHSTYRLMLNEGVPWERFESSWAPLRSVGCNFERFTDRLVGVDVRPEADIAEAYRLLERGMSEGTWLFEEVHVGHSLATRKDSGWRGTLRRLARRAK